MPVPPVGFVPSRGFPPCESVLLSKSSPSCCWLMVVLQRRPRPAAWHIPIFRPAASTSTSGISPHMSPFTCSWCYPLHRADPLLGFMLSKDFSLSVLIRISSHVLQRSSPAPERGQTATPALRSLTQQRGRLVSCQRLPPFLSFASSSPATWFWIGQLRAYGFTLGFE
jgi:hypothetical protein